MVRQSAVGTMPDAPLQSNLVLAEGGAPNFARFLNHCGPLWSTLTHVRPETPSMSEFHGTQTGYELVNNLKFCSFIVRFWDGKSKDSAAIFSVVVHAPAH
jgi:hypothetical protein